MVPDTILCFIMVNDYSGDEEVKRFQKALGHCRTCTHVMMAHKLGLCMEAKLVRSKYSPCKCKLFVPSDNLEFLEWVAQNKNRRKGEKR